MVNIKNEEYWTIIEDLPCFAGLEGAKAAEWLYRFQETSAPHLSSRALIQLEAVIRNVYEAGVEAGKES